MNKISHIHDVLNLWQSDGDLDAQVMRIPNTGPAITSMTLSNPLGRVPVGLQVIKKNKACDVVMVSADANKIIVQFTAANADVNIRVW